MCTCSTVRESERGGGWSVVLPLLDVGDAGNAADLREGKEGFRGGRGGAFAREDNNDFGLGFGGDSRLINGVMRSFVSSV